ncbi:MAG: tyrosine-type recombinase/integrase [Gammaproteobacteria bacterium]
MKLTQKAIDAAKPKDRLYRLFDTDGLYLEVPPTGGPRWRLKYFFEKRERRMSLGTYPEISLKDAREKRDALRKQIAQGIDPAVARMAEQAAQVEATTNSFEAIAREWHTRNLSTWSPDHAERVLRRLDKEVFPYIGSTAIKDVKAPDILAALRRIEARGLAETAHRARADVSQVFRYAVATGRATDDPTAALRGALKPVKAKHFAAITDPKRVGALIRAIRAYEGDPTTRAALQLLPLVLVRPGELRHAMWSEFDLDEATWRIPAGRMKMRREHLVPLSRQAVAILRELEPFTRHHGAAYEKADYLVFPSLRSRDRPMSENTLNGALRRMGFAQDEMTSHGFRAMASTLLHEQGWNSDAIERQLAHAPSDQVKAAYHRGEHLAERRRMLGAWADYLDSLAAGAAVIGIKGRKK